MKANYKRTYEVMAFQITDLDDVKVPAWFKKIMDKGEEKFHGNPIKFSRHERCWIKETVSAKKKIVTKRLCLDTGWGKIFEGKKGDWIVKTESKLFIVKEEKFNEENGWSKI